MYIPHLRISMLKQDVLGRILFSEFEKNMQTKTADLSSIIACFNDYYAPVLKGPLGHQVIGSSPFCR